MLLTAGRIVLQLLLSGPLMIFYPVMVMAIGMLLYSIFNGDFKSVGGGLFLSTGGLGLTGLYASILLPLRWLRSKAWLRWLVVSLLAIGVVMAGFFVFANFSGTKPAIDSSSTLWMLGGPLIVTGWNLWRMFAKERT